MSRAKGIVGSRKNELSWDGGGELPTEYAEKHGSRGAGFRAGRSKGGSDFVRPLCLRAFVVKAEDRSF